MSTEAEITENTVEALDDERIDRMAESLVAAMESVVATPCEKVYALLEAIHAIASEIDDEAFHQFVDDAFDEVMSDDGLPSSEWVH